MRFDIINYIARGSPALHPDLLSTYTPRDNTLSVSGPRDLLPRFHAMHDDDGHIVKVARSLLIAREATRPYADRDWLKIRGEAEWLAAHRLLLDSVEARGEGTWIMQIGFPQAWKGVPEKSW